MATQKPTETNAPVEPLVMPLHVIYLRTGVTAMIVEVKPDVDWPNHSLRAEFCSGAGFTFHRDELFNLFTPLMA